MILSAATASAQLAENLKAYTGRNASGYFMPLVDALAADLNAGTYHTARIPDEGLYASVEIVFMSARFSEADRTFPAGTENGFQPDTTLQAPTIVGSPYAVRVDGEAGTTFYFPGGFDLGSFDFVSPQLRLGALWGTEATIRFGLIRTGGTQLGDMTLYGFGGRHSLSQYFDKIPVDVAVGAFWQHFALGENERGGDLVSAEAWTAGIQASKRFGWAEPFLAVAYDDFGVDLDYEGESPSDAVHMSLESDDHYRMTFGLALNASFAAVHGEFSIGGQRAFAVGLAVGFQRQ